MACEADQVFMFYSYYGNRQTSRQKVILTLLFQLRRWEGDAYPGSERDRCLSKLPKYKLTDRISKQFDYYVCCVQEIWRYFVFDYHVHSSVSCKLPWRLYVTKRTYYNSVWSLAVWGVQLLWWFIYFSVKITKFNNLCGYVTDVGLYFHDVRFEIHSMDAQLLGLHISP